MQQYNIILKNYSLKLYAVFHNIIFQNNSLKLYAVFHNDSDLIIKSL